MFKLINEHQKINKDICYNTRIEIKLCLLMFSEYVSILVLVPLLVESKQLSHCRYNYYGRVYLFLCVFVAFDVYIFLNF